MASVGPVLRDATSSVVTVVGRFWNSIQFQTFLAAIMVIAWCIRMAVVALAFVESALIPLNFVPNKSALSNGIPFDSIQAACIALTCVIGWYVVL